MDEKGKAQAASAETPFIRLIGRQAARKIDAQRTAYKSAWLGLGASGVIGWSVSIPTLGGAAAGVWIDAHYPSGYSWTLMLLVIGLLMGCFNAWHWVSSEERAMRGDADE